MSSLLRISCTLFATRAYASAMTLGICLMIGACHNSPGNASPGDSSAVAGDTSITGARWNMGIALYSFNHHPFVTALDMVDSAQVRFVEGFSFEKLGAAFGDSTMGQLSLAGIGRMDSLLHAKGLVMRSMYVENSKDAVGWKRYFDQAKALNMQYLVCEPPKDQWDMIDSLAGIYGIPVAIHEHSKAWSHYWHPDSVMAALKGHPNFGACADLGHWARSGLDPVKCLQELKGHIIGVHLKDIDSLNNTNANDVTVGTGVIDFPAVIKELKSQDFKGMIYMECEHKMDNNLQDVIQSLRYFDKQAATIQ